MQLVKPFIIKGVIMKLVFPAVFAAILLASSTTYAANPIALTVTYKVAPGSGPQVGELGLGQKEVFEIAKSALENKGWKVVRSPSDAAGGVEAKIDINAVQNAGGGSAVGFAVAIGMFGVSNGTSSAAKVKRVAFNYSNTLVSYGGSYDFAVQNTRKDVATSIKQWIASTF